MYLLIRELTTLLLFGGAYLHPTMYLLILKGVSCSPLSYLYLHPTMYLLIRSTLRSDKKPIIKFTSHYVSINSIEQTKIISNCCHLHPTMYLLIPGAEPGIIYFQDIYIPLCIY